MEQDHYGHPEAKSEPRLEGGPLAPILDGGVKAWSTVAGAWLVLFATYGYMSSFGVYQDFYAGVHAASPSDISWIGSVQNFLILSVGLLAGKLVDMGYFKYSLLVGSILYTFSLFMLSLAHPDKYYQIFLPQGLGMGLGAGLVYLPALAVQAHHWRKNLALAMGIALSGASVGGIVYPIMLNNLFYGSVGFAWGVRATAFLNLLFLLLATYLMSTQHTVAHNHDAAQENGDRRTRVHVLLRELPYILALLGICLSIWGLLFPVFYLQLFATFHGLSNRIAFYTLTIQNAASFVGRIIPNFLADRLGMLNVLIVTMICTGIVIFSLLFVDPSGGVGTTAGVVIFAVLYGFFSGSLFSLLSPAMASFTEDKDTHEISLRMGIGFFLGSFAYLTGPPIDGAFLGVNTPSIGNKVTVNPWLKATVFSGACVLAGVPLLIGARYGVARRMLTWKV